MEKIKVFVGLFIAIFLLALLIINFIPKSDLTSITGNAINIPENSTVNNQVPVSSENIINNSQEIMNYPENQYGSVSITFSSNSSDIAKYFPRLSIINLYNSSGEKVAEQNFSSMSDKLIFNNLLEGNYVARVEMFSPPWLNKVDFSVSPGKITGAELYVYTYTIKKH